MAFQDFSRYIFGFSALDTKMPDIIDQRKYYDRWMCKYSYIFSSDDNFHGIEWDLRCRKTLREIFSSATFFMEAKKWGAFLLIIFVCTILCSMHFMRSYF